jgi:hypothetical protein
LVGAYLYETNISPLGSYLVLNEGLIMYKGWKELRRSGAKHRQPRPKKQRQPGSQRISLSFAVTTQPPTWASVVALPLHYLSSAAYGCLQPFCVVYHGYKSVSGQRSCTLRSRAIAKEGQRCCTCIGSQCSQANGSMSLKELGF